MKRLKLFVLVFTGVLSVSGAAGQANASINVLTQNSGNVNIGGTVNIQVTVGNTGPTSSIGIYKIRTQVSVPSAIAGILPNAQQTGLPAGWTITSNNGSTINLSNGTDIIPVGVQRTILIAVQGNTTGGPSTVSGGLSFSNGNAPGTGPGTLAGDITADNTSQSSITVINSIPVTLADFTAALVNCQPSLRWTSETEINSDRFEIERTSADVYDWVQVGVIGAGGNTATRSSYNFTDRNLSVTSGKILYRLKMIDKDGRYKYSEILPVSLNCNISKVSVWPNPVQNGKLYVSLTGTKGYTQATLLSLSGQVILTGNLNNGTNHLDVSKIANGLYILSVNDTNGINEKIKVLIQN